MENLSDEWSNLEDEWSCTTQRLLVPWSIPLTLNNLKVRPKNFNAALGVKINIIKELGL